MSEGRYDYDELFAKKMKAAGITHGTRIGVAVSGGADSTALCVLLTRWLSGNNFCSHVPFSNVISFVVDHGLRENSALEACLAQSRVTALGIRCEILQCSWESGIPVRGRIQAAARDARYNLLHEACWRNGLDILLTAHHADDQMELFIMRLSRHSGLPGLACMPFVSEIFQFMPDCIGDEFSHKLLLVRPLLDLCKHDLYKVCKMYGQLWIEDPTNDNLVFLRNRIRKFLNDHSSCLLRRDLGQLITVCRNMRTILERKCNHVLNKAVAVNHDFGYITLDLKKIDISEENSSVLATVFVLLTQFVAQNVKPSRGRAIQAFLQHFNKGSFKGMLNLNGCNLCCSRSSNKEVIICASCDRSQPVLNVLIPSFGHLNNSYDKTPAFLSNDSQNPWENTMEHRTALPIINVRDSMELFHEAKHTGLFSETSTKLLLKFANGLCEEFHARSSKLDLKKDSNQDIVGSSEQLFQVPLGQMCYFMNRFVVFWEKIPAAGLKSKDEAMANQYIRCSGCACSPVSINESCCFIQQEGVLWMRCMDQQDYLLLSKISKMKPCEDGFLKGTTEHVKCCNAISNETCKGRKLKQSYALCCCMHDVANRAQAALWRLRHVPIPARRGLPVFVNAYGALLGIPSLRFSLCPNIHLSSEFKPKIPLGGGRNSWL